MTMEGITHVPRAGYLLGEIPAMAVTVTNAEIWISANHVACAKYLS